MDFKAVNDQSMKVFLHSLRIAAPEFKGFGDDEGHGVNASEWDAIKDAVKAEGQDFHTRRGIMSGTVTPQQESSNVGTGVVVRKGDAIVDYKWVGVNDHPVERDGKVYFDPDSGEFHAVKDESQGEG